MMQHSRRSLVAVVLLVGAGATTGCAKSSTFDNAAAGNGGAAKVQNIGGVQRITLSAQAARRIGIEMSKITAGRTHESIPYAAVLYDASGKTFTFTSPAPRVYVQKSIRVAYISGNRAILRSGPPAGTTVVTVGSAELLGAAHGVEEG